MIIFASVLTTKQAYEKADIVFLPFRLVVDGGGEGAYCYWGRVGVVRRTASCHL